MIWVIIAFFAIMIWKYFSYDDDEEMKGFKAFWSTVAIMGFGIVGYFSIIVFFDGIREFWKVDGFVGAICFATSDFMLTGAYFKAGQRSKAYMATYSVCYYIAQFAIAFSLFFI